MSITPGQISATNINIKKIDQVLINNANISYVNNWTDLSALEPAIVNKECIIRNGLSASSVTGRSLARRGISIWGIPGADNLGVAYLASNPVPALQFNPFKTKAYLSPQGADLGSNSYGAQTTVTMLISQPPFRSGIDWTGVRLWLFDINGSPVKPDNIWVGLANGGNMVSPNLDGGAVSYVAATGLTAPPSGTDNAPGLGPVCNIIPVSSTPSARQLVLRFTMPAGDYTVAGSNNTGIGTNTPLYWPGVSAPRSQGSISANPGTTTGWGEAFGVFPAFILEYTGLSSPVCQLAAIGDSHVLGYTGTGVDGVRGVFGEVVNNFITSGWSSTPNVSLLNLGRSGHKTNQISTRLHTFEGILDIGGWLRERASINDHDDNFDVTTTQADASWTTFQNDYNYVVQTRGKLFIPFQGAGATGWASGWYSRFIAHEPDEIALVGAGKQAYVSSVILSADGSYKPGLAGVDNGHPNATGYSEWAVPMWPALKTALNNYGVTV